MKSPERRRTRVRRQETDGQARVEDRMELVYGLDLEEVFVELVRRHRTTGGERPSEFIRRVFPELMAEMQAPTG